MDWITEKTGTFLNGSALVLESVVQSGAKLESNLSPAAMRIVKHIVGNDVLSAGFFLMILGSFYSFFRDMIIQYYYSIKNWFYVSIEVQEGDETFKWLSEWVAERPLTTSVRHITVKAIYDDDDDDDGYYRNNTRSIQRPRLVFLPGTGTHVLYHKGYKINVSTERPEHANGENSEQSRILASIQKKQTLTISTFGRDLSFLKSIVKDAMEDSFVKKEGKTTIYTTQPYDTYWSGSSTRVPRAFHSVILAPGVKEDLLNDIAIFRKSAQWYQERGVPYRRGYLLHGPPGTGKTSFIVALAGHLGLSVCIVNLSASGLNDQQLDQLLNNAPRNSILLMEDVDAALIKRQPGQIQSGSNNVTLSGLLNSLDGITAQEGSIVFMTTNHVNKLAPALIRPGRCDRKILFDYAQEIQIKNMFLKFFLSRSEKGITIEEKIEQETSPLYAPINTATNAAGKEKGSKKVGKNDKKIVTSKVNGNEEIDSEKSKLVQEQYDKKIYDISERLTKVIRYEDSVTTAQLQGFFMRYREDVDNIIEKVPGFLDELRKEREEIKEKKLLNKKKKEKKRLKELKAKERKEREKKKALEARIAAGETIDSDEDDEDEDGDDYQGDYESDSLSSLSDSELYEQIQEADALKNDDKPEPNDVHLDTASSDVDTISEAA